MLHGINHKNDIHFDGTLSDADYVWIGHHYHQHTTDYGSRTKQMGGLFAEVLYACMAVYPNGFIDAIWFTWQMPSAQTSLDIASHGVPSTTCAVLRYNSCPSTRQCSSHFPLPSAHNGDTSQVKKTDVSFNKTFKNLFEFLPEDMKYIYETSSDHRWTQQVSLRYSYSKKRSR